MQSNDTRNFPLQMTANSLEAARLFINVNPVIPCLVNIQLVFTGLDLIISEPPRRQLHVLSEPVHYLPWM